MTCYRYCNLTREFIDDVISVISLYYFIDVFLCIQQKERYTVAWRYEFYFRVAHTDILKSMVFRARKMSIQKVILVSTLKRKPWMCSKTGPTIVKPKPKFCCCWLNVLRMTKTFRRPKSLGDYLVHAQLRPSTRLERSSKGTVVCGKRRCHVCNREKGLSLTELESGIQLTTNWTVIVVMLSTCCPVRFVMRSTLGQ